MLAGQEVAVATRITNSQIDCSASFIRRVANFMSHKLLGLLLPGQLGRKQIMPCLLP